MAAAYKEDGELILDSNAKILTWSAAKSIATINNN